MKIGILTFHFAYNYGAMLQAYALSHFIKDMGLDVTIIDYRPAAINYLYRPRWADFFHHPLQIAVNHYKQKKNKTDFTYFEEFLSDHLRPDASQAAFDAVIAGSDQVWNPDITKYDTKYLLDGFGDGIKKFSYAASLGKKTFDAEWEEKLKRNLSDFEFISVREEQSRNYLKRILPEKEIYVTPDPVFLPDSEKWKKLERRTDVPDKYILFYSLSMDKTLQQNAAMFSGHENMPIVSIHPLFPMAFENGIKKSDIGPREFLWLIHHAQYICTDSFHAASFSMIFGKSVLLDTGRDKGGRISNVLRQLHAVPQKVHGSLQKYELQDKKQLAQYRIQGTAYIEKIIGTLQGVR